MIRISATIIVLALSACTQAPVHLAIGPTCPYGTRGCLPAYLPHETDPVIDERVLADHALCRAVPPETMTPEIRP